MNVPARLSTPNLNPVYALSLAAAVLMALASMASLLFPEVIYPTEGLRQSFIANDVVNLFIGLPILLVSMVLARRGRLIGLLFWPGALFFIAYNYLAYAVAMPMTWPFLVDGALVILSLSTTFMLLTGLDAPAIRQRLDGAVPGRLGGGVLVGFGLLFFAMQAAQVVQALNGQVDLGRGELATAITDLVFTPVWVAGGILLWQRRPLGYLSGMGLLFQASMLFVGLLVFFLVQPLVSELPFRLEDFLVILVMSLVCLVPLGLFARGAR